MELEILSILIIIGGMIFGLFMGYLLYIIKYIPTIGIDPSAWMVFVSILQNHFNPNPIQRPK